MRKLLFILLLFPLFVNAITPVFTCGFECGRLGSTGQHWKTGGTAPTIVTGTKRSGDRGLEVAVSGSDSYIEIAGLSASNIWVCRFYVKISSGNAGSYNLAHVISSGNPYGPYFNSNDGKIYSSQSSPVGGVTATLDVFIRIDMKINTSANPWTFDCKVDGVACTQTTLAAGATTLLMRLGVATSGYTVFNYYDDVIISNTSGDYPLGAGYVNHFVPTSDGTHNIAGTNDFERSATGTDILNATTTAFQLVDDVPLKSGVAAEYINLIAPLNANNYVELVFGPAPGISTPTAAPRVVSTIFGYANSASGTNNLRIAINDNGTTNDVFNGNAATTGTTIIYTAKSYSDPPSAASVWTLSGNGNFNNVRMRCYTSDDAPDPWLASAMIEAEFQEQVTLPHRIKIISKNKNSEKGGYATAVYVLTDRLE
jgi:hypothetical protein